MTEKTIDLDQHRGMAAQKATDLRRLLHNMQSDLEASVIDLKHLTDNLPISRGPERRELPTVIIDRRRLVRLSEVRAWRPDASIARNNRY